MNRPNMSISYGGESNKQQKSNLMKDNPVAKHASAMNMGKAHSKSPNYKYSDTPMELTSEGKKKILASDANPSFKKAIAKSPVNLVDPKKKGKMKKEGKLKQSIYGEMRDKKTGKIVKTIGTKPGTSTTKKEEKSPVKNITCGGKKYKK